ncbi:hypothetical protein FBEOM_1229 [Fusarium beomiforme]|uniref:Zn(2)-C6 fungal-type domain-containing protein n=1 Tax=Fusarium beomiforme TaxID=44412 RepID=A0A9P5AU37_9HYPO|nr:hypothetical protein FBEOM_1229 [Fusarium beomiforme]
MERNDPPARRKSCQACKKARRRCDLARPTCQRCAQRSIHCHYPYAIPQRDSTSLMGDVQPLVSVSDIDASFHGPGASRFTELRCIELVYSATNNDGSGCIESFSAYYCPSSDKGDYISTPGIKRPGAILTFMMMECLGLCNVISSAALHAAKNHLNARVIRDNVESRVQDLLSSPPATTPLETLAYAQALFIYQVLRLQDNDARVYTIYEATMPHLEEASNALIPYIAFDEAADSPTQSLDLIPLYPASAAHEFWSNWIFQESAKRTLGMINFFLLTYYFMKGESGNRCGQNKNIAVNRSVTMSAHLWNAQDPVDFALAWRNKKHFVINVSTPNFLETIIQDAQKDDIDAFGKICLTSLMGLTEAKGCLAMKGVTL